MRARSSSKYPPPAGVLEAFVVEREAFDEQFLKPPAWPRCGTVCRARGAYAVADGNDRIEVVVLDFLARLAVPLQLELLSNT